MITAKAKYKSESVFLDKNTLYYLKIQDISAMFIRDKPPYFSADCYRIKRIYKNSDVEPDIVKAVGLLQTRYYNNVSKFLKEWKILQIYSMDFKTTYEKDFLNVLLRETRTDKIDNILK